MCGIVGFFGFDDSIGRTLKGLETVKYRGIDGFGLSDGEEVYSSKKISELKRKSREKKSSDRILGHCLHAMVGYLPQPLIGDGGGCLASNCEVYNWRELSDKYDLNAKNDSEMLLKFLEKKGIENIADILDELDGVYAFAYWLGDKIYLARDIIGVKPLWYSINGGLAVASEKKVLEKQGFSSVIELNPRSILEYDLKQKKIRFIKRRFFELEPEHKEKLEDMLAEVENRITDAVEKRVPDRKVGVLFSGGVDSTLIALLCRKLGVDFTCYTSGLKEEDMKDSEDIEYARKIAKDYGFPLRVREVSLKEVESYIPKVVDLIEDSNVVKVGVGLTIYLTCEMAKEDGVRVIFSGLGSEEVFTGYERHKQSSDVNKECLSGLLKVHERDLYRDDVITMNNNIELRLPFLDKKLVGYALKIPAEYKLSPEQNKLILRMFARKLGLKEEYAFRKKRAAQYGSRFDRALSKIASRRGFKYKSDYMTSTYGKPRLGVLFSSGKDSMYATYVMSRMNYPVECLISVKSVNPESYMFHTHNIHLAELQAEAMEIPLIFHETQGLKEKELEDLREVLEKAKSEYEISGIVTGALASNYQRERVEKIAGEVGLKVYSPLWGLDQENEFRLIIDSGFEVVLVSISAYGLDKSWLNKSITQEDISRLASLNKKLKLNVAGEGGEFESLILDAPLFKKKKLVIVKSEVASENEYTAKLLIKKAELVDK